MRPSSRGRSKRSVNVCNLLTRWRCFVHKIVTFHYLCSSKLLSWTFEGLSEFVDFSLQLLNFHQPVMCLCWFVGVSVCLSVCFRLREGLGLGYLKSCGWIFAKFSAFGIRNSLPHFASGSRNFLFPLPIGNMLLRHCYLLSVGCLCRRLQWCVVCACLTCKTKWSLAKVWALRVLSF